MLYIPPIYTDKLCYINNCGVWVFNLNVCGDYVDFFFVFTAADFIYCLIFKC